MVHGGFGIWCCGELAPVLNNHCKGKIVKDVHGMNIALIGKTISKIASEPEGSLNLQPYGWFIGNSAVAAFQ
eukprot:3443025-Ditylum_brightwellii.AAC.1